MARKRKYKWDFLNDFKPDKDGKYEYTGSIYVYSKDEFQRKRDYARQWALLGIAICSSVGSGFIDAGGIVNTYYVIIPFLGEIICLFTLAHYHFKLLISSEVREYNYSRSQPRIPIAISIFAFFSVVGFAASLIFCIITGFEGGAVKNIIYLVLKAFNLIIALIYRKSFYRLEWVII